MMTNSENSASLNVSNEIRNITVSLFEYHSISSAAKEAMKYIYPIEKRLLPFHDELILNEC